MRLAAQTICLTIPPPTAELRATLLAAQARFALLCGNRAESLDLLGQAQALLEADGSGEAATDAAKARVLLQIGRSVAHQNFDAAHEALIQSKALWAALGEQWGEATALAELGALLSNLRSSHSEARVFLEQSVIGYRSLGDQIGLSEALMHLSRTSWRVGLFSNSLSVAREAYAIAEASANPRLLAQAGSNLGAMLIGSNKYLEAFTTLEAALTLTEELGHWTELPTMYSKQGNAAIYLGRYEDARAYFSRGLAIAQQLNNELDRCSLVCGLAAVALAEGDYTETLFLANEAVTLSVRLGEGYLRTRALPYRALALRHLGRGSRGRPDALATLRLGLSTRSEVLMALWVVALLLADAGALARAAEVFALSEQKRQLDNVWLQDIALRELRAISAGLPPQVAAQAQARWARHDIWVALEELCAELEAEGWDLAEVC